MTSAVPSQLLPTKSTARLVGGFFDFAPAVAGTVPSAVRAASAKTQNFTRRAYPGARAGVSVRLQDAEREAGALRAVAGGVDRDERRAVGAWGERLLGELAGERAGVLPGGGALHELPGGRE